MFLLHPGHRRKHQSTHNTHKRGKHLPDPNERRTTRPKEFHKLTCLVQVLLTLYVVFVVSAVGEVQFGGQVDVGFVKGDEEEGEDLADFDEEDLGLSVIL
jgi:hypothetical protein